MWRLGRHWWSLLRGGGLASGRRRGNLGLRLKGRQKGGRWRWLDGGGNQEEMRIE